MNIFKGSIETTVFNTTNKMIKVGDIIVLLNFSKENYRGGVLFRVGDGTKVIVNDESYEFIIDNKTYKCTEYLQMWSVKK